jgi:phosphoribosylanthranilate isomerase
VSAPRRTRIKFCGMTRAEDIACAAELGVDAIGLIFAMRSPRRVGLATARALRTGLPPMLGVVALLMDNEPSEVRQIVQILRPELLQFHGSEDPGECAAYGVPWLKAVPMARPETARDYATRYAAASGLVLDSHAAGAAGGSGQRFAWDADARGHFGPYGGSFVAETLMRPLRELAEAYDRYRRDPEFLSELDADLKHYVGRPSPIYHAERLSREIGGAQILLKREDLNHTGAHKINNTIGQAMLARRMGKTRIIAETGAGQHGVASATVAARWAWSAWSTWAPPTSSARRSTSTA